MVQRLYMYLFVLLLFVILFYFYFYYFWRRDSTTGVGSFRVGKDVDQIIMSRNTSQLRVHNNSVVRAGDD